MKLHKNIGKKFKQISIILIKSQFFKNYKNERWCGPDQIHYEEYILICWKDIPKIVL